MGELVINQGNNFNALAEAMGMSADIAKPKKQASTLARLKLNHKGIMGETEVNGKRKKLEVVEAGSYSLDIQDQKNVYCKEPKIRLFNQRFMYKRYIQGADGDKGRYVKTIMSKSLDEDLRDNMGGFNCGKPSGYVKDYQSLPEEMKALMKSIKRVRVLFGEATFENAVGESGEEVPALVSVPFIWEVDNKDAFKTMGAPIAQLAKQNRILPQHYITLGSEERSLPTGASYFLPVAALDLSSAIELTDKDQATFISFNEWIDNYNDYIVNAFNEASKAKAEGEYDEVVEEFVDVEVEA